MIGRTNILLFMVDQVMVSTLRAYGGKLCQTPNLNRLAEEGLVFDRAYTTSSLCSPARASVFTGVLPHRHGILNNVTNASYGRPELSEEQPVLSQELNRAGYACGYYGKWHIGIEKGPVDYGFSGTAYPGYGLPSDFVAEYDDFLKRNGHAGLEYINVSKIKSGTPLNKVHLPFNHPDNPEIGCECYSGVIDVPSELSPSGYIAQESIEYLRKHKEDPFFLVSAFWGPHHPALPSPEFAGTHDPSLIPEWPNYNDDLSDKPRIQSRYVKNLHRTLDRDGWAGWQEIVAAHFDFMSMIDAQIGRVLDELAQLGLDKNTIVIFTSDHGDTLGCHGGQWDKGPYMYEETYRVPLIVRGPGIRAGRHNSSLVSNMDLFATVLDQAGVSVAGTTDSISLRPIMQGDKETVRDCLVGEFHGFDSRGSFLQRMLLKDNLKYIYNPSDYDELYDLQKDPDELKNRINDPSYQQAAQVLKKALTAEMTRTKDPFAPFAGALMGLE
ncbi:MAG: sulfatase-like hydrolase/transferase [Kiritimatiellales bacterium]